MWVFAAGEVPGHGVHESQAVEGEGLEVEVADQRGDERGAAGRGRGGVIVGVGEESRNAGRSSPDLSRGSGSGPQSRSGSNGDAGEQPSSSSRSISPSTSTSPSISASRAELKSASDSGSTARLASGSKRHPAFCSTCRTAVLALFDYIALLPTPPLHPANAPALELARQHEAEHPVPGQDGRYAASPKTYMRHLLMPRVLTLGCCHHAVMQICREAGLLRLEFPGVDAELNKFLFKHSDLPVSKDLPDGLRWGEVREQDIDLVKSRTSIPRSTRTLMSLKSVAVFDTKTDTAVAWTFLGLDGSLTTLHTEEGYRGKGIAKAVASRIFRQHASGLAVDSKGNAWSHADVYAGNAQSESVCRSLGGKATWKCFWVRIDLDKAGTLAKSI